jgi:2-dehydropantoate 2-reductase
MVEAHPAKLAAGRNEGLMVAGHAPVFPSWIGFADWTPPENTVVLLCTKTYDNPAVLARLGATVLLIPVQNGFDPALDQRNHPGEGIASFVSECARDRPETRITRPGSLHLGARREVSAEEEAGLTALAESLAEGGLFPVERVPDVRPYKAAKLMYNAAISPLAAAAGVDNGELLTDRLAKRLFFALLRENYSILRHARVPLARIGPFHPDTVSRILRTPGLPAVMAIFFRPSLRGTYCSMAPDLGTGRTEIEAYNGHLIRLAGSFPCPLNRGALALIERIVREGLAPGRSHLEGLRDCLEKRVWN